MRGGGEVGGGMRKEDKGGRETLRKGKERNAEGNKGNESNEGNGNAFLPLDNTYGSIIYIYIYICIYIYLLIAHVYI
jgi:hypothetical protein